MTRSVARPLLVSFVLALCGVAGAQGDGPLGALHWVDAAPVPAERFGRTASGDFDGDGVPDLATLRGETLEVVLGPGLFDVHLEGIAQAESFCVCPAVGGDVLIAAGPTGITALSLDKASEAWITHLVSPLWVDARLIVLDHPSGGAPTVLGVMSDGRSLRRVNLSPTGWSDAPLFTLPVQAIDLALVQFDGSGPYEVAVATAGALAIFSQGGALQKYWMPSGLSSVGIGRLDQPGTTRDWISWLVTRADGQQELRTVGLSGALAPQGMSPTPSIVDLITGDFDGDGCSDVVLSHTALHHLVLFHDRGDGETPLFDYTLPGALELLEFGPSGTPAPDNEARPTLVDVDCDGDVDTLMPVQSTGEFFVGRNAAIDEDALEPAVDVAEPLVAANLTQLTSGALALDLKLALELPLPAEATHVELIVWRRAAPGVPTEPQACERVLLPLQHGGSAGGQWKLDAALVLPPPPDMIPGTNVRFEGIYLWLQRPVRIEAGAVTRVWPARVYGMETSTSPNNHDWIVSLGGVPTFPVHEKQAGTTLPDQIGCGSELPCLPEFPSGKLPKWN